MVAHRVALAAGALLAFALIAAPSPAESGSETERLVREADAAIEPRWRKQELVPIPAPRAGVVMRTALLLPFGRAPYPLALINHGTTENDELRQHYDMPRFAVMAAFLLARGYAVALPQRPGHGETGGPYLESAGGCDDARYLQSGYATADSIGAAAASLLRRSDVHKGPVLLVGHSAGAWGALALASRSPDRVRAVINFSGGRGGRSYGIANRNCAPERLVAAAAAFARSARAPTLWLYAQNDSYFPPALSRRMAAAYRAAGGRAEYHLLPPVGSEGHLLIYSAEASRHWSPLVEKFLASLP